MQMTTNDLRAWQQAQGYTYETAAQALGMSRSGYANLVLGNAKIDLRTALACAAIVAGIKPIGDGK
jgi:transcriptional regulator with XRE-family HTH domain